jgi:hypothetical protein
MKRSVIGDHSVISDGGTGDMYASAFMGYRRRSCISPLCLLGSLALVDRVSGPFVPEETLIIIQGHESSVSRPIIRDDRRELYLGNRGIINVGYS